MEHSIGGSDFQARGTMVLSSNKRGNRRVAKFEDAGKLGPTEVETFKESVRNQDVYRIRMRSRPDDSESPYVVASIPACQLLLGKFKEKILIRENEDGSVSSLEYANPYFHGDCVKLLSGSSKAKGNIRFKSAAAFVMPNEADPVPLKLEGNMFVKGAKAGGGGAKKGDKKGEEESKSFFQRYWHIILPVGGMMLLSNLVAPPQQGGGARR